MSLLKRNIIANFAGQGWSVLMALAFVPIYIKFLGIEAYGLIGFFAMLQASFQVLDLGLSQTMNREMARYSVSPDKALEMRDFVRTFEFGYWAIGIAIGAVVLAASPFIAEHWINPGAISVNTVQRTVMIMGCVAAFQWPLSFYEGGLLGLQRQVLLNGLKITISTLNCGGAVLILWLVSPTVTAFFKWQIVVSALNVSLITFLLWRSLPSTDRAPRFDLRLLRTIWRFAAGMGGITLASVVLMQMDKVILSKLLSLKMFGYYTLASVASSLIPVMIVGPLFNALFPRFTSLATVNDDAALKLLYHQSSQLVAVLVLPVAVVLAFFSFDIMLLWTGSEETARIAAPILRLLVIGMGLNGLMSVPYALQLAHGWTSLGLRITIFLILTIGPTIIFMTMRFGALGAASVWIVLNGIYLSIGLPLTHRRLLQGEMRHWFEDVGPSLAAALFTAGVGRWLIAGQMPPLTSLACLFIVLFSALLAAAFTAPHTRTWLLVKLRIRTAHV